MSPVSRGDFYPRTFCILLSMRPRSLPDVQIVEDDVKSPTRRKRLSLKVVKDRSYFTESARFKFTKLTTTFLIIWLKTVAKTNIPKHSKESFRILLILLVRKNQVIQL